MPRRLLTALVLAALAAVPAACAPSSGSDDSSGDFRGDQRAVATTVEDLEQAASDNDEDKICRDLLAPELVRRLAAAGNGCPAAVDAAIQNADSIGIDVKSVRINGNRATAQVVLDIGDDDRTETITLIRARPSAGWRIAELPAAR
jgi:hypothetical protein